VLDILKHGVLGGKLTISSQNLNDPSTLKFSYRKPRSKWQDESYHR
ncbi:unnamed protein product, partial [Larinioides sclopetarius]